MTVVRYRLACFAFAFVGAIGAPPHATAQCTSLPQLGDPNYQQDAQNCQQFCSNPANASSSVCNANAGLNSFITVAPPSSCFGCTPPTFGTVSGSSIQKIAPMGGTITVYVSSSDENFVKSVEALASQCLADSGRTASFAGSAPPSGTANVWTIDDDPSTCPQGGTPAPACTRPRLASGQIAQSVTHVNTSVATAADIGAIICHESGHAVLGLADGYQSNCSGLAAMYFAEAYGGAPAALQNSTDLCNTCGGAQPNDACSCDADGGWDCDCSGQAGQCTGFYWQVCVGSTWMCQCSSTGPDCGSGTVAECDPATGNWNYPTPPSCTGEALDYECDDDSLPACDVDGNWICGDSSMACALADADTCADGSDPICTASGWICPDGDFPVGDGCWDGCGFEIGTCSDGSGCPTDDTYCADGTQADCDYMDDACCSEPPPPPGDLNQPEGLGGGSAARMAAAPVSLVLALLPIAWEGRRERKQERGE